MSRTVCSWCQNPLVLKDDILVCGNIDCPACDEKYLHEDLIRTRKALDVAKDAIRHADWFFDGDYNIDAKTMHNEIKCAIKAITALEQKD